MWGNEISPSPGGRGLIITRKGRVGNEVSEWFPVRGAETGMCEVAVAVQLMEW